MDAGRLRERITIEQSTRVANGQGGWNSDWVAIATKVPAEIIALSGDEALRDGIERSSQQYRVRLRKRDGLTPKERLQWKGQVMEVHSVLPDPKEPNSLLLLICSIGINV